MKTTQQSASSPFNDWFAFQKHLNWSDDRFHHENIRRTFLEAIRLGISRAKAFFDVANKVDGAGRTVDWRKLHELWRSAWDQWNARQNSQAFKPSSQIPPVLNGHGLHKPAVSHTSKPVGCGLQHNGNHHHKPLKSHQKGGASLVSYYL
jgi:hypothetical protein